jgi:hypothetical protein
MSGTIDFRRRAEFHEGRAAHFAELAAINRALGVVKVAERLEEYAAEERAAAEREWAEAGRRERR